MCVDDDEIFSLITLQTKAKSRQHVVNTSFKWVLWISEGDDVQHDGKPTRTLLHPNEPSCQASLCLGTSPIPKVLLSPKIFKSSHLDGVEVLYCSIDSLRCSASSGASKCFALQLMKLLFNASAIQRCSRQILSPHQLIKCFWSFIASGYGRIGESVKAHWNHFEMVNCVWGGFDFMVC